MAGPVLLVADDLATIAAVKRVLAREGYEVVLATSAADAVIAWGHHTPDLVLLQPSVESERGSVVLEELEAHPEAKLLRVVLLGETVPGFAYPVEPLPLDPQNFAKTIAENVRGGDAEEQWQVQVHSQVTPPSAGAAADEEPEDWRASAHPLAGARPHGGGMVVMPPAQAEEPENQLPPRPDEPDDETTAGAEEPTVISSPTMIPSGEDPEAIATLKAGGAPVSSSPTVYGGAENPEAMQQFADEATAVSSPTSYGGAEDPAAMQHLAPPDAQQTEEGWAQYGDAEQTAEGWPHDGDGQAYEQQAGEAYAQGEPALYPEQAAEGSAYGEQPAEAPEGEQTAEGWPQEGAEFAQGEGGAWEQPSEEYSTGEAYAEQPSEEYSTGEAYAEQPGAAAAEPDAEQTAEGWPQEGEAAAADAEQPDETDAGTEATYVGELPQYEGSSPTAYGGEADPEAMQQLSAEGAPFAGEDEVTEARSEATEDAVEEIAAEVPDESAAAELQAEGAVADLFDEAPPETLPEEATPPEGTDAEPMFASTPTLLGHGTDPEALAQLPLAAPEPPAPAPSPQRSPPIDAAALEASLFGDIPALEDELHRDVEAAAMASVESSLSQLPDDSELQRLEEEVRAEAARRRQAREAAKVEAPPPADPTPPDSELDFSDLEGEPSAGPTAPGAPPLSVHRAPPPPRPVPPPPGEADLEVSDEEVGATGEPTTAPEGVAAAPPRPKRAPARQGPSGAEADRLARAEVMLDAARDAANEEADADQRALEAMGAAARRADHAEELVRKERAARGDLEDELARLTEQAEQHATLREAHTAAEQLAAERERVMQELKAQLEAGRGLHEELSQSLEDTRAELKAAAEAAEKAEARLAKELKAEKQARTETAEQAKALKAKLEALEKDARAKSEAAQQEVRAKAEALEQQTREKAAEAAKLQKQLADAQAKLGQSSEALKEAKQHTAELEIELTHTTEQLETTASRVEAIEAEAQAAAEKLRELENRAVMPLALPGRQALGVARNDTVGLEGLSRLLCQLVLAQADVKLECGAPGGLRTLWLKKGAVVAAESNLKHESLIDRARRDGLIDGRQETELRALRTATPGEQLEALSVRGMLREAERAPLVQRYTEQVALDAFCEEKTQYRLTDDAPGPEVLLCTAPRATLPMLAESLRRALPVDALLELLGGALAVPVPLESELELRALGFSDKERKMLSWVDGDATVEDVTLASGLKPELAFRALLVAKLLHVIEVKPPAQAPRVLPPDLDVRRLEAKFDEVQDADYFTILGLTRTAGTDDVKRAYARLAEEFDPIRYSGHADPALQQRAQVIARVLDEAARALEDDRRRQDYARHLLD